MLEDGAGPRYGDGVQRMVILLTTFGVMALAGVAVSLAGMQWPALRESPRLRADQVEGAVDRHAWIGRAARARLDPASATGLALTAATILLVLGGVAFGIVLVLVRSNVGFQHVDSWVARFAARHASPVSTSVLRGYSQLGGALVLTVLCVVMAVTEVRRRRFLAVAAFLVLCVGGQFVVVNLIKALVNRARPNVDRLTSFSGASFPSGHAAAAAAAFAAFALLAGIGRSSQARSALAGLAVAIAVGVACTRAFLGVHWLSDVLAGLALGWAWFALCSIAFGGRLLRFGAPAAQVERAVEASEAEEESFLLDPPSAHHNAPSEPPPRADLR